MISTRSFFTRILAALAVLISVCYGGARLASGQYSPAGGNTFGGATYPLNVADAAGLSGPVPVVSGGTGQTALLSGGSTTVTPCGITGMLAYWITTQNLVAGDAATAYTWTDICSNAVQCIQPVNNEQFTIISSCYNGHPCLAPTNKGTSPNAQFMNCPTHLFDTAGAIGFFSLHASNSTGTPGTQSNILDFFPTSNHVGMYVASGSQHTTCLASTNTNLAPTAGNGFGRMTDVFCGLGFTSPFSASGTSFSLAAFDGTWGYTGTSLVYPLAVPVDGGITIGNQTNGNTDAGSYTGTIFTVGVMNHMPTPLEQDAIVGYDVSQFGAL